jgi:hypothetical protein
MRATCTQILTTAVIGLLLAGCQTQNDPGIATCYGIAPAAREMDQCAVVRQSSVQQIQAERTATGNQVAREVRDICLSYGLQPGTQLYTNCLVREADTRRPSNYAQHFSQPGFLYDQNGNRVDSQGYLVDRAGNRIGGKGYWIKGPGNEIVPPGTYVDASTGRAIQAPPPRSYSAYR